MDIRCYLGFHNFAFNSPHTKCSCVRVGCDKSRHDWRGCKCKRCNEKRDQAHEWNGCECSICYKTRDQDHDFGKDCEACSRCRTKREDHHSWDGCKCSSCGKKRDEYHARASECEKCTKCGSLGYHNWSDGKCTLCGTDEIEFERIVVGSYDNGSNWLPLNIRIEALRRLSQVALVRIATGTTDICRGSWENCVVEDMYGIFVAGTKYDREYILEEAIKKIESMSVLGVIANSDTKLGKYTKLQIDHIRKHCESNGHEWNRCKCSKCYEIRDEAHEWNGCKCSICDKIRNADHKWNGCKCSICDTIRNEGHKWNGCKCSQCGREEHNWEDGRCRACGRIMRNDFGWTALHGAIHKDADLKKIRDLCLNKLVNVGDEEGWTPLMKASGNKGNLEIVKLLVEMGANINARSIKGTTALSMAKLHGNEDVAEYLIENGARVDFTLRRS
jgi:hypothetical protein